MLGNRSVPEQSISLVEYATDAAQTDVIDLADLDSILQGLFGEVGGVMSAAKKLAREGTAYVGYRRAAEEEFGDVLWYFSALCRRLNVSLDHVFAEAANRGGFRIIEAASDYAGGALAHIVVPTADAAQDNTLFRLARSASDLMDAPDKVKLVAFAANYLEALHSTGLSFADVARRNIHKIRGAFIAPNPDQLVDFDRDFPLEEQLPRQFEIRINQRTSGKSYLRWNGVFVGDPLTDNIEDRDGYRFHDVFHFAHAAILHWSPVMRALIHHKRKSRPEVDETQDSGRAIVVEEGVSAWIFARAKELDFFEGQKRVSLDILKTIGEFVTGYEVSQCPLKLWERTILDGYAVFRQVRHAEGGWIVGDRFERTIRYEPLDWKE